MLPLGGSCHEVAEGADDKPVAAQDGALFKVRLTLCWGRRFGPTRSSGVCRSQIRATWVQSRILQRPTEGIMSQPTLVITSGYFNPLHVGHLALLRAASELGDEVTVIVNNDAQQLLKKGRVITPEDQRLEVAGAIRYVDHAVLSIDTDETVCDTLEMIAVRNADKHIIFANGGDRDSAKAVPEEAVCKAHGIEMIFDLGGNEKLDSSTAINQAFGLESL